MVRSKAHPLVERTRSLLVGRQPTWRGPFRNSGRTLDIGVSSKNVPRALRIMDALLKGAEARGFRVAIGDDQKARTSITVNGEELRVQLLESQKRTVHVPGPKELWPRKHDFHWTGRLVLHVGNGMIRGVQSRWADGKRRQLEEQIDDILEGLERAAASNAESRREWDRKLEEMYAGQRRQEEERARQAAEEARFQRLREDAARWHEARLMREYIAAVEVGVKAGKHAVADGDFEGWRRWAQGCVERLDPLRRER